MKKKLSTPYQNGGDDQYKCQKRNKIEISSQQSMEEQWETQEY